MVSSDSRAKLMEFMLKDCDGVARNPQDGLSEGRELTPRRRSSEGEGLPVCPRKQNRISTFEFVTSRRRVGA